jgi:hypothetical protein
MLATLMLDAKGVWNHDAFFDYVDRWMSGDVSGGGSAAGAFVEEMWSLYRSALPDAAPAPPTCGVAPPPDPGVGGMSGAGGSSGSAGSSSTGSGGTIASGGSAPASGGNPAASSGGAAPDGGPGAGSGAETSDAGDDGGCGCRMTGPRGADPRGLSLIALGLAVLAARRRL